MIEWILAQVDALAPELVAFTQDLVRVPTVNPPGEGYAECARLIGERLAAFGYTVRYISADGLAEHTAAHPRVNVIGRLAGAAARPVLHFNGHFDVVPPGHGWTVDPFGGCLRDGRIYGRGVADQKAGIAAAIYAVEAVRRAGYRLGGTVEQSGTVDEESGGFAGVAYLCERGEIARDRTDYVVITEPLNYDRVGVGHRGVYWFEVVARGRTAHGSMPGLGVNAADLLADFIAAVNRRLKPRLAGRTTSMPVEPPLARHATINLNALGGGQIGQWPQTPCVPDEARAVFDRRFLAEEPFEAVRAEIADLLASVAARWPGGALELRDLMVVHPVETPPGARVVAAVEEAVQAVLGRAPARIASPGTYDQKHVMRIGGVAECLAYGPGILDLAHQPNEYVEVEHLLTATKVLALAAVRLLGAEPRG